MEEVPRGEWAHAFLTRSGRVARGTLVRVPRCCWSRDKRRLVAGKTYTAEVTVFNGDKSSVSSATFTAPKVTSTATVSKGKRSLRVEFAKTYGRTAMVQQRVGGKWKTVRTTKARAGKTTIKVAQPGRYRVVLPKEGLFTRVVTPTVTVGR